MQDQKLMDYFKLTEEDLQVNRNGNFSEAQKKKITSEEAGSFHGDVWVVG